MDAYDRFIAELTAKRRINVAHAVTFTVIFGLLFVLSKVADWALLN